ncbi:SDR family oxidoreductase [Clostridium isatidis]|uniref:NAD(P)-dependent oxidoreductase n=1 Tax=Clostridium isatidis TaxID=182773 RepID=A0A343JB09_9CLOT|nr:SDR family oxidoreductase [Clostridium isatidis]ASW42717.1 NAD(P)-dependent oxidoreductase [Clostridium isatidis]
MNDNFPKTFPPQKQNVQPGIEEKMNPKPIYKDETILGSNRLKGKVAVITGGDSGIGRAVSVAFAREGAKVAIIYLNEHDDANKTKEEIEKMNGECLLIPGDIGDPAFCTSAISQVINRFKAINILVNNAAEQHVCNSLEEITNEQFDRTFRTNIYGPFYLTREALKHLKKGDCIINTTSITAYKGNKKLIDYSMSKGALVSFTRSLALNLVGRGIRVNAVAPGPVWSPLIPASDTPEAVSQFGGQNPSGRAGQPVELAESYVFLASDGASYITGETIHVNGGEIANS